MPVSVASMVKQRTNALSEYAAALAAEAGLEFVEIVRPKIYKYQLVEIDGSRLHITGMKEARNAVQIAFGRKETAIAEVMYGDSFVETNALDELFVIVVESLAKYSPKLFGALRIDGWKDRFFELDGKERSALLKSLIAIGGGKDRVADLTAVGGSKYGGCLMFTYGNVLTKGSGITFVDQSITGMFERRTHIGL